ncbi:hypothetical protein NUSPORA_01420 [Nucleospora cyclopteri]
MGKKVFNENKPQNSIKKQSSNKKKLPHKRTEGKHYRKAAAPYQKESQLLNDQAEQ